MQTRVRGRHGAGFEHFRRLDAGVLKKKIERALEIEIIGSALGVVPRGVRAEAGDKQAEAHRLTRRGGVFFVNAADLEKAQLRDAAREILRRDLEQRNLERGAKVGLQFAERIGHLDGRFTRGEATLDQRIGDAFIPTARGQQTAEAQETIMPPGPGSAVSPCASAKSAVLGIPAGRRASTILRLLSTIAGAGLPVRLMELRRRSWHWR